MLNDAGDEPDQLPVLQHALMRTWSHWRASRPERSRRIDLQDYEAIGGFDGALNQHADELLADVPAELAAAHLQAPDRARPQQSRAPRSGDAARAVGRLRRGDAGRQQRVTVGRRSLPPRRSDVPARRATAHIGRTPTSTSRTRA